MLLENRSNDGARFHLGASGAAHPNPFALECSPEIPRNTDADGFVVLHFATTIRWLRLFDNLDTGA